MKPHGVYCHQWDGPSCTCSIASDRERWRGVAAAQRAAAIEECTAWITACATEDGLQFITFAGVTKFDVGFMAIHPDLWRIQQLSQEMVATTLGACLTPVYSFLSLTEASEYITNEVDWAKLLIVDQKLDPAAPEFATRFTALRKRTTMYAESRVHPQLPDGYPIRAFTRCPSRDRSRTTGTGWVSPNASGTWSGMAKEGGALPTGSAS